MPYLTNLAQGIIKDIDQLEKDIFHSKQEFLKKIENPRICNFAPISPDLWDYRHKRIMYTEKS